MKKVKNTKYITIVDQGDLEQVLIGSLLGDGCFTKVSGAVKNSRFSLAHSSKQKEYFLFKYNIFKKYGLEGKVSENTISNERYKEGYTKEIRFKSKSHPIFTKFRKVYNNGKKRVILDVINNINVLGLAIWYMDDGNINNYSCDFNVQSFTLEEREVLQKLLQDKFNIKVTITNNTLYVLKENFPYFVSIIKPFIIKEMEYKLKPYKMGSV